MKLRTALLLVPLATLILVQDAGAKEWHGIIPLHSRRADVVSRFSQCANADDACTVRVGKEDAYIVFSSGAMSEHQECARRLPSDTVLHIEVELDVPRKMADLGIRESDFTSFVPSAAPDNRYKGYLDKNNGWVIETYKGRVTRLYYIGAGKDVSLCPSYYQEPQSFVDYSVDMCCPPVAMICPAESPVEGDKVNFSAGTIAVRRATYKWQVSDGRIIAGQGTLRITVDTTGAGGRKLKAILEMRGGKNHESTAGSCEVVVSSRRSDKVY